MSPDQPVVDDAVGDVEETEAGDNEATVVGLTARESSLPPVSDEDYYATYD